MWAMEVPPRGLVDDDDRRGDGPERWGSRLERRGLVGAEVLRGGEHRARCSGFAVVQMMDGVDRRLQGEDAEHQREAERDQAITATAGHKAQQAEAGEEHERRPAQLARHRAGLRKAEMTDRVSLFGVDVQDVGSRRVRHDGADPDREGQRDESGEGHPALVTSNHGGLRATLRAGAGVVKAGR